MSATDCDTAEILASLTGNGVFDLQTAIEKFQEVGLSPLALTDKVKEFASYTESGLIDIDVCCMAYEHILEMADEKISSIVGFDICDDIETGGEFYVAGNYMSTSFDYSEEAQKQLEETLQKASLEDIRKLSEDNFVRVFLKDVEIDIKEILQNKESEMEVES
jgi:hypothetical protein